MNNFRLFIVSSITLSGRPIQITLFEQEYKLTNIITFN